MRQGAVVFGMLVAGAAVWLAPSRAEACGGCFGPPPGPSESVVVTAHRMAVAISPTETTLWDQFQYAGSASDFAWILPIEGMAQVELADNAFFEALDQATQVSLQGTFPPLRTSCSDPCPSTGLGFGGSDDSARGVESDGGIGLPDEGGVMVYHEGVVGPYETATIGSEDPEALLTWLQDNGYTVPDAILPIISHYVALDLNFAALKLNGNAGVSQMQPVRVTTPGFMPVFPLRMISAGAAEDVGLTLYVLAEGRYGAQNFPTLEVDQTELHYDWDTDSFNYQEVFDGTLAAEDGRAWIVEYAQDAPSGTILSYQSWDDAGIQHTASDDWAVVTRGIAAPYLSVLRAEMPVEHLSEDLILEAVAGDDISNAIQVPRDVNRPPEPDCPTSCESPGNATGSASVGTAGGPGAGVAGHMPEGLCSAAPGSGSLPWTAGLLLAAVCAGLAVRRRR